jgi:two-component sensor histidine kinase
LSVSNGQLDLTWSREIDGNLKLVWREIGGPPVQTPTRQGFGGRIIEQVIAQRKGKTLLHWRKEGLVCEIVLQT